VGWVPQRPAQYAKLTPRENLELFARLEGVPEPKMRARRLLELLELPDDDRVSAELSGGNQQRLNLAVALLAQPDVLLLDEATASLDPRQRRRFWERFADLGFVGEASDFNATTLIADARNAQPGRVTFVGAGPGDAEHLTIKAVRALQGADVILFDELVSDEVLELARREARRILVRPRRDETGTMVTSLVKQGRHVVRLTSGDPVVSGIADGEAAGLRARNIPVTIVRGVSRLPDVAHAQRQYSSM
jgi:hypothetical protein